MTRLQRQVSCWPEPALVSNVEPPYSVALELGETSVVHSEIQYDSCSCTDHML